MRKKVICSLIACLFINCAVAKADIKHNEPNKNMPIIICTADPTPEKGDWE